MQHSAAETPPEAEHWESRGQIQALAAAASPSSPAARPGCAGGIGRRCSAVTPQKATFLQGKKAAYPQGREESLDPQAEALLEARAGSRSPPKAGTGPCCRQEPSAPPCCCPFVVTRAGKKRSLKIIVKNVNRPLVLNYTCSVVFFLFFF